LLVVLAFGRLPWLLDLVAAFEIRLVNLGTPCHVSRSPSSGAVSR
jgi:hypothetical protein